MRLIRIAVAILVCGAAGCAAEKPVDTTGQTLDTQLTVSANKIDNLLGDISRAGGISARAPKPGTVVIQGELMTVEWQGDAPEVLRKIAAAKGLNFVILGRPLPTPISIDTRNTRFVEVLENIGMQLGGRADVVLKSDALEIHYRAL